MQFIVILLPMKRKISRQKFVLLENALGATPIIIIFTVLLTHSGNPLNGIYDLLLHVYFDVSAFKKLFSLYVYLFISGGLVACFFTIFPQLHSIVYAITLISTTKPYRDFIKQKIFRMHLKIAPVVSMSN